VPPTAEAQTAVLNLVPTHEEEMLRESVAGICASFGPEYMLEKYKAEEPPAELWDALAEKGFLTVNLPEEYGGGGLGMSALAQVAEEISFSGNSLLLIVVSPAIAGSIIAKHGTDDQKDRWIGGMCRNEVRIAFGITEPDAGSNSHKL
jgi:alkylation response protein AidB-like acyl-CoA dehydrogenase